MRRDSIFYTFFQRSPTSIFDLLPNPPANAHAYRFDSVSVKEAKFEMDGVFLPPDDAPGTVYFCEVQMQKDKKLYERMFAEAFLYFYRQRARFTDWQVVVIYPSRGTEQAVLHPFRAILNSEQMHRIYLDDLGDIQQLPLWIALMVLTTVKESKAIADAQVLISRAQQEKSAEESRVIIELIATIIGYKFEQLSLQEIQAMLDIPIKESRLYQEGRQEGRQEGQSDLLVLFLRKRLGDVPEDAIALIHQLTTPDIEALGEALLDFSALTDLQAWLQKLL
jgi:predicted transposase/invertase (TIGR01784 family)